MRVEQLYFFLETAKIGSINAAATKLHISQQSLNTTLKNLEKEIGHPLFLTSNKGIVLTKQGELTIEAAKDVIARIDRLKTDLGEERPHTLSETLSIRATHAVVEGFLSDAVSSFTLENPHIHVNLQLASRDQIIDAVKQGTTDLGLLGVRHDSIEKTTNQFCQTNLTYFPLYQYKLQVVVSRRIPLAQSKSISMKTLLKQPIILLLSTPLEEDSVYCWLKQYGEPDIAFTTSSFSFYKKELQTGRVVGFYSNYLNCGIRHDVENDLKLLPIRGKIGDGSAGYLVNNDHPLKPAARLFINRATVPLR